MDGEAIRKVMSTPDLYIRILSIADFIGGQSFSFDIQQSQYKVLQKLADNMNEPRAVDTIRSGALSKLMKNLS